jgi:hypothetical protein
MASAPVIRIPLRMTFAIPSSSNLACDGTFSSIFAVGHVCRPSPRNHLPQTHQHCQAAIESLQNINTPSE